MNKLMPTKIAKPVAMKEEDKWRVEDAMRTLEKADEIRRDREMMRSVKSMVKTKIKSLGKIC